MKRETDPEKRYQITELIPLDKLQNLQDTFAQANQVASTLTAIDGTPITRPSNHSPVCAMIRATEKGLFNCIKSGHILGEMALKSQQPVHIRCLSIGFTDAAAPIVVAGEHIANWTIGQYHPGNVDEERVREYAQEIGADVDMMVIEFNRMEKHSLEAFEQKLEFLGLMANELSDMAYQRLQQEKQTAELKRVRTELEQYQTTLEQKVQERTEELTREIHQRAKIQKRQARLVTAIEHAVESIVITHTSGKIIYVNPAFEKLTGYSAKEAIGKNPRILKSGVHDEQFYRDMWQTITQGEVWQGRFSNKKKDGTIYLEDSTISPVRDGAGKIINYVAVKKDVTKEIALEQQLMQAQRMESIGLLAAGVAHEINTPVQYVLTNTHFFQETLQDLQELLEAHDDLALSIEEKSGLEEKQEKVAQLRDELGVEELLSETGDAIEQVLSGIEKISDTVTALKEFAEPAPETKQPADLNRLIESVTKVSRSVWQDEARLTLKLDKSLRQVPLHADKIKQVLLDMIMNSAYSLQSKFGSKPEKGMITLTTRDLKDTVELVIEDNGSGIDDEVIDKIFDPFFTTKPFGQGSGQGLSVAHSVIFDNHQGNIRVITGKGEGATFIITLPAGREDAG